MKKIRVHYISGPVGDINCKDMWGGTKATNYTIKKAFEGSEKYELVIRPRTEFFNMEEVNLFIEAGDIGWIDETSILQKYFSEGFKRPDLIGPISRAPVKRYNNGEWEAVYTPEWFYDGKLLRLNEAEEKESTLREEYKGKKLDFVRHINFIRHAVDTEMLKPNPNKQKKYVLWAGNTSRAAKNYEMFEKIMEKINKVGGLPPGYEFKILSKYAIDDYFKILEETAILVNTSKYESFCCAVAEGMAKGVPTLVRKDFNGVNMFKDRPLQVEYEVNAYVNKIMELVDDKEKLESQSKLARKYAEDNFSFKTMREDIEKVLDKILVKKK